MSQEAILNIVLSTVVAITAIFALFQTHKQIKGKLKLVKIQH